GRAAQVRPRAVGPGRRRRRPAAARQAGGGSGAWAYSPAEGIGPRRRAGCRRTGECMPPRPSPTRKSAPVASPAAPQSPAGPKPSQLHGAERPRRTPTPPEEDTTVKPTLQGAVPAWAVALAAAAVWAAPRSEERPPAKGKGKTDPAGAPLEARLI